MSALGQKQTLGRVRLMSALPPKRTLGLSREMSALCQKRTHASQHSCGYFCDWVERLWRLFVHYNGRQNWTAKIKACCKSFGHRRSRAKAADNISCEAAGGTNFAAHRGDTLRG